jgi:prepilin-type processing-associated H-X9-DG protein
MTHRRAVTLVEVVILLGIIGVLLALLLPAVQQARDGSARAQCLDNLRQIGLALTQYHGAHSAFPPGVSSFSLPYLAWHARILPFLEQSSLWEEIPPAFDQEPYLALPPHQAIYGVVLPVFLCPTEPRTATQTIPVAFTSYLGNEGTSLYFPDGILYLDSHVRLTDIRDGMSNTLLVGERPPSADERFGHWYGGLQQVGTGSGNSHLGEWESVLDAHSISECPNRQRNTFRPGVLGDPCDDFHFWSTHPGGANFLFADVSARFLPYSLGAINDSGPTPTSPMHSLATRAGGEPTPDF